MERGVEGGRRSDTSWHEHATNKKLDRVLLLLIILLVVPTTPPSQPPNSLLFHTWHEIRFQSRSIHLDLSFYLYRYRCYYSPYKGILIINEFFVHAYGKMEKNFNRCASDPSNMGIPSSFKTRNNKVRMSK